MTVFFKNCIMNDQMLIMMVKLKYYFNFNDGVDNNDRF